MWGGSALINTWIDTYVAGEVKKRYAITLKRVPMDAGVFVNKLITEKQAGISKGTIDMIWVNGENFKNLREADVLFGPFTSLLPNFNAYVDPETAATDFGYPVEGYEAPYGKAQFVFEYDSARLPDPPETFDNLKAWIKSNPGKFTYPQPPDFTGSAFIRQLFYAVTGGYAQYMETFDPGLFRQNEQKLWDYLQEIEPFLWQEGQTYPKSIDALDTLFENGEVLLNMSYHQAHAQSRISNGLYPDTVKTYVMKDGSIYNTHFTAIPASGTNIPGALTVINFLLSPEAQYSKNLPENWGDFTVLDTRLLGSEDRLLFESLDTGAATLDLQTLDAFKVPEIPSQYLELLEKGWDDHILRGQ